MESVERLVVCAQGVTKRYAIGTHTVAALCGVDLAVRAGELLALAGSSGSGKTTFLNLLGCLDLPTSGEIFIDGIKVSKLTTSRLADLRARKIGYVFQHFNLIPTLTAVENVEYPLLILGECASTRRIKATEALANVGLAQHAHRRPTQLSGGQQQRVAIARAIVKRPALVLADEPTASLDRRTAHEVLELMQSLNSTLGISFILSSHDPLVLGFVKRVISLVDGKAAEGHGGTHVA